MFELTSPAEEIQAAKILKQAKYASLTGAINSAGWKSVLFTVEEQEGLSLPLYSIPSTNWDFLGLKFILLMSRISLILAKCSYAIYLASNSNAWDQDRALVEN